MRQKLKTMVTDPARVRRTDPGDPGHVPGVRSAQGLFDAGDAGEGLRGLPLGGHRLHRVQGLGRGCAGADLNPIQERRAGFTEPQVVEILQDGSARAQPRAEQTMREVHAAMQMLTRGQ